MSAYLALAAISVLAGFGLLTRLRLPVSPIHRWYLAPGATMLVWAIALGVGVSLGLTLRTLSGPLLALTMVVAILGALDARRAWAAAKPTGLLILAAMPLAVMAMDVAAGLSHYIGGSAGDGWSYVAYGQYLWEWPKGTEGGLAPLHQYAAHLNGARFIASAMLGLFSPLTGAGGDTQAAAGAFVAWTLFVFGASCAASADGLGIRRGWLVLLTATAVISPWVHTAVMIHNYDNLLALSFLPFAMSVVAAAERPGTSVAVLLGALVAATLYTYPEMSPFVGFGLALAVACRAMRDRLWLAWGRTCLLSGALAALLLIPGRADLVWFFWLQLRGATGAAGTRSAEGIFPYLLDFAKWPTAFWGLQTGPGGLHQTALAFAARYVIAASLWILSVVGIVSLLRRRRWDVVLLGLGLSAGAVLMVAQQHYAYGAYKLLLLGNWALAAAVTAGAEAIAARVAASGAGRAVRLAIATVGVLIAIAFFGSFALRQRAFHQRLDPPTAAPFRALTEVEGVIGSAPILVAVDNDVANAWTVYFLRHHAIRLLDYRGYMAMPHLKPLMDRSAAVEITTGSYILSDDGRADGRDVVWQNSRFVLWRFPTSGAPTLVGVSNPNGTERLNGRSFYWIGQGETIIDVVATADGDAALSASLVRGPSLPEVPVRRLRIATATGESQTFTIARDGAQSLIVPVRRGLNRLVVRAARHADRALSAPAARRYGRTDRRCGAGFGNRAPRSPRK